MNLNFVPVVFTVISIKYFVLVFTEIEITCEKSVKILIKLLNKLFSIILSLSFGDKGDLIRL